MHRTPIHGRIGWAAAKHGQRSVAVEVASLTHRCQARAGVSSMPANDSGWMHWLDRSEAGKAERQRPEQPGQTEESR